MFAILIIASNYLMQFYINDWLAYGAIVYPFTFLLTDVLSEKHNKKDVFRVVWIGSIMAIVPTIMIADYRIAIASIATFFIVQQFDVSIFHKLKKMYPKLWWVRNNVSTIISQFFDTVMFYTLAFAFIMPYEKIVMLIIGDYTIKVVMALLDTPAFYLLAVKMKPKPKPIG